MFHGRNTQNGIRIVNSFYRKEALNLFIQLSRNFQTLSDPLCKLQGMMLFHLSGKFP